MKSNLQINNDSNNNAINIGYVNDVLEYPDDKKNIAFSYQNINQQCPEGMVIECSQFMAYCDYTVRDFIFLKSNAPSTFTNIKKTKGWKLHISLRDHDDNDRNIENGWEIVKDILIKYNIYESKIIKHSRREALRNNKGQHGKTIVIYCFKEPNRLSSEWEQIITEITAVFLQNNIIPGPLPSSDSTIQGSQYFSYRNDAPISMRNSESSNDSQNVSSRSSSLSEVKNTNTSPIHIKNSKEILEKRLAPSSPSPENYYTQYDFTYNDSDDSNEEKNSITFDPFKNINIKIANQPLREIVVLSSSSESEITQDEQKKIILPSSRESEEQDNSAQNVTASVVSSAKSEIKINDAEYQANPVGMITFSSRHNFFSDQNRSQNIKNKSSCCPCSKYCVIL